ncbi:MAG: hypothetical protein GX367_04435 [Bacteroidales bacterium]|nr:hypothetical protein [Bacteroidales bacterium]
MDSIQQIAMSKIADVLSSGTLIYPTPDIWKKIFYNAGQSELYEENSIKLHIRCVDSWNQIYKHDDRCYSALLDIFSYTIEDLAVFTKIVNSIVSKINMYSIFNDDVFRAFRNTSRGFDLDVELLKCDFERKIKLLDEYSNQDFKYLKSNLNILGLDITFDEVRNNQLIVSSFSFIEKAEDKSTMVTWLEQYYPNILESYEAAIKMHGEGNSVECLINCRNVLTGIFSYNKDEKTKWYSGLQKACKMDKNISNIKSPSNIPNWRCNPNNEDINKRYNYPRFKTIAQLYSFLSDLGAHKDEGNIIDGIVDHEKPEISDALLGLRMTEDVLIWLYQNRENNL